MILTKVFRREETVVGGRRTREESDYMRLPKKDRDQESCRPITRVSGELRVVSAVNNQKENRIR